MAEEKNTAKKGQPGLEESLADLGRRLEQAQATRPGAIVFHASGARSGSYRISTGHGRFSVAAMADAAPDDRPPALEVIGDSETIQAILDGRKNAVKAYLGGGLRVRGDLRYLSDLALELGLIDAPL